MKGLTGSAGAMVVIALGLFPGSNGKSLRQEAKGYGPAGGVDAAGSPSTDTLNDCRSRRLQRRNRPPVVTDDALDVNGTPAERAANALTQRTDWAETEVAASEGTLHVNNGDRSSAATFHKSLPHDSLGQVDTDAFDSLIECISEGDFDTCEKVPAGDEDGFLVSPLGGLAVNMAGPASSALTIPSASVINSEDLPGGHATSPVVTGRVGGIMRSSRVSKGAMRVSIDTNVTAPATPLPPPPSRPPLPSSPLASAAEQYMEEKEVKGEEIAEDSGKGKADLSVSGRDDGSEESGDKDGGGSECSDASGARGDDQLDAVALDTEQAHVPAPVVPPVASGEADVAVENTTPPVHGSESNATPSRSEKSGRSRRRSGGKYVGGGRRTTLVLDSIGKDPSPAGNDGDNSDYIYATPTKAF